MASHACGSLCGLWLKAWGRSSAAKPSSRYSPIEKEKRPGWHDFATKRSEEHTSELQSLMRISYAVFCLKKKKQKKETKINIIQKISNKHIKLRGKIQKSKQY